MRTRSKLLLLIAVFALVAAACGGGAETTTTQAPETTTTTTQAPTTTAGGGATTTEAPAEPILIGAAIDLTSFMSPFDAPASLAAQLLIEDVNAAGGVLGREVVFSAIDTQVDPEQYKAAAIEHIQNGASVVWVTCDVDFSTPAIQEGLNAGLLTVAPCIGTDQMGPKRFGDAGRLAFSFGNMAQDEGAAMAEFAYDQGWRRAAIARDNLIVYFQNVVDAFKVRFEELGGEVVLEENWTNGDGTIGNVATSIANSDVDVVAFSTGFDDLPGLVTGVRSLGAEVPMICSWACDGAFWVPEGLNEFYYVTYASVFGDDPSADIQDLIAKMEAAGSKPTTGGFVGGADAVKVIVAAIEATGGTDAAALADWLESMTDFPGVAGPISLSSENHTVFGRPYRVIKITDGQHAVVDVRSATSPADIG